MNLPKSLSGGESHSCPSSKDISHCFSAPYSLSQSFLQLRYWETSMLDLPNNTPGSFTASEMSWLESSSFSVLVSRSERMK